MHAPTLFAICLIFCSTPTRLSAIRRHTSSISIETPTSKFAVLDSPDAPLNLIRRADNETSFWIGAYHPPSIPPIPAYFPPPVDRARPPDAPGTLVIRMAETEGVQTSSSNNIRVSGVFGQGIIFFFIWDPVTSSRHVTSVKFRMANPSLPISYAEAATRLGTIYYFLLIMPSDSVGSGQDYMLHTMLMETIPRRVLRRFETYRHEKFTDNTRDVTLYDFVLDRQRNNIVGYACPLQVGNWLPMGLNASVL